MWLKLGLAWTSWEEEAIIIPGDEKIPKNSWKSRSPDTSLASLTPQVNRRNKYLQLTWTKADKVLILYFGPHRITVQISMSYSSLIVVYIILYSIVTKNITLGRGHLSNLDTFWIPFLFLYLGKFPHYKSFFPKRVTRMTQFPASLLLRRPRLWEGLWSEAPPATCTFRRMGLGREQREEAGTAQNSL